MRTVIRIYNGDQILDIPFPESGIYSIVFICNGVLSTITEAGVVVVACQYEVDRGFSRSGRFYADDFGTAHYCSGRMTLAVKKSPSME